VGSSILSDWLSLRGILNLEMACMSSSARAILLSFLANVIVNEPFTIRDNGQCRWAMKRRIKFVHLHLDLSLVELELASSVLKRSSNQVIELHLLSNSSVLTVIGTLGFGPDPALTLPSITHLSFEGLTVTDAELLAVTQNASQLTTLRLHQCTGFSSEGLRNFFQQPMALHTIDIKNSPVGSVMTRIVSNCPHLQHLGLVGAGISREEMMETLTALPPLVSLSLGNVTDGVMLFIAHTQTALRTISLQALRSEVSGQTLTRLFATCRSLTSLSLHDFHPLRAHHFQEVCPLVSLTIRNSFGFTDIAVLEFARRSPALTHLCLLRCDDITQELPLLLLRECPLLTSLTLVNGVKTGFAPMDQLVGNLINELYPSLREVDVYLQERSEFFE
jgi:hypothetical protein